MRRAGLVALATLFGVVMWPPHGFGALAFVALAPLVAALDGLSPRAAFGLAWLYVVATALLVFHWFPAGLVQEFLVPAPAAWAFTVAIIGFLALTHAAAAAGWAALARRVSAVAAPLVFAALWTLSEWLRTALLGTPWLILALTQGEAPWFLQSAELGGAWAPGFLLAASGAGVGLAAVQRRPRALLAPALVLLGAGAFGAAQLAVTRAPGEGFRVAVIQASIPPEERFQPGTALRNTQEHAALTRQVVAAEAPDLVVWSETAVDDDLDLQPALREMLESLVREIGVPLVTGAPRTLAAGPVNAVVLVTPEAGLVETYAKQRLVPIAEGDAAWMEWLIPLVDEVAEGQPYVPGTEATVFRGAPAPFASPVCFEVTYPGLMREFQAAGAEWMVNLSNDVWFGNEGYPEMHLAHAVLRAIELRTWLVRGANSGISAAIDPQGRVVARVPAFVDGHLVARVEPSRRRTFYARFGDAPVLALLCLGVAAAVASGRRRS